VSNKPLLYLIRSLLVVDFHHDERSLYGKKAFTSAQNLVFSTFDVNFDQLRNESASSDEIVQGNRLNLNDFSSSKNRMVTLRFDASMRTPFSATPETDTG